MPVTVILASGIVWVTVAVANAFPPETAVTVLMDGSGHWRNREGDGQFAKLASPEPTTPWLP